MGRKKNYKPESFESKASGERYIRLYESMLTSDAYKDLSHSARTVYTILKLQYKGDYTGNTVKRRYKDFQEYGMNTSTIKRALVDLENHGFIKIKYGTKMTRDTGLRKQMNEYTFVSDWKYWKPDENI